MKTVLGRKQTISNNDWIRAAAAIEMLVSREEIELMTAITTAEIRKHTAGKNAAYAWSGGKDSLVLGDLAEKAGVHKSMMAVCDLEYPAFVQWVAAHRPENMTTVNTGQDLQWLATHLESLFAPISDHRHDYSVNIQIRAQNQFYRQQSLDIILLGRRKADGNYVGKGTNIYTDGKGMTKYNPLSDWSHEAILAYIHYNQLSMPPFYGWKNGYKIGTHPWFGRLYVDTVRDGWCEVYEIDPSIVINAALHISSAREYLEELQYGIG